MGLGFKEESVLAGWHSSWSRKLRLTSPSTSRKQRVDWKWCGEVSKPTPSDYVPKQGHTTSYEAVPPAADQASS